MVQSGQLISETVCLIIQIINNSLTIYKEAFDVAVNGGEQRGKLEGTSDYIVSWVEILDYITTGNIPLSAVCVVNYIAKNERHFYGKHGSISRYLSALCRKALQ